jgi:hypothetical protein
MPHDGNDVSMSIGLQNRETKLSKTREKIDMNFVNNLLNAPKRIQRVNFPSLSYNYEAKILYSIIYNIIVFNVIFFKK